MSISLPNGIYMGHIKNEMTLPSVLKTLFDERVFHAKIMSEHLDKITEKENELKTKDCIIEQLEYRINNQKYIIEEKNKKIEELSTKLTEVAVENGKLKSELEEVNKQIFRLEDELGCIKGDLKQLSETYCGDEEVEEITQGDTHTPYPYESGRDYFTAWFGDDR